MPTNVEGILICVTCDECATCCCDDERLGPTRRFRLVGEHVAVFCTPTCEAAWIDRREYVERDIGTPVARREHSERKACADERPTK